MRQSNARWRVDKVTRRTSSSDLREWALPERLVFPVRVWLWDCSGRSSTGSWTTARCWILQSAPRPRRWGRLRTARLCIPTGCTFSSSRTQDLQCVESNVRVWMRRRFLSRATIDDRFRFRSIDVRGGAPIDRSHLPEQPATYTGISVSQYSLIKFPRVVAPARSMWLTALKSSIRIRSCDRNGAGN